MRNWWKNLFEPKPYNTGYLSSRDGHKVFFMELGNPEGKPILFFHGGPGGGCCPHQAKFVDLRKYRVIMFDQRGCGRSLPSGKLENNTTESLLNDAIYLITELKIKEKIVLRGGSWGSALALLFAERYPEKVEKLLLSQIFMADENCNYWEFDGCRWFYPEFVEELECKSKGDIREFFAAEIKSKSNKKQLDAANYYGWYERICGNLNPHWNNQIELTEKELASHRVFMHYSANNFFLQPRQIMNNINKIKEIPAIIVHNRLDFVCPPIGAYQLHKALPKSKLIMVPERGHIGKLLRKTIMREFRKELAVD